MSNNKTLCRVNGVNGVNEVNQVNQVNEENDKILNYVCECKNNFLNSNNLIVLEPCSHIFHDYCINNYISANIIKNKKNHKCPLCDKEIKSLLKERHIYKNNKYKQLQTDIRTIKFDQKCDINYTLLPIRLLKANSLINKLLLVSNQNELINTLEYFLRLSNIKINLIDNTKNNPIKFENNTIKWVNQKDIDTKIVIIPNHTHYIDSFIIYYLFKCGFVSADIINKTDLGKIIASKCNLLIFKRGQDTNMVQKIKEYLEEKKIIGIFPEGAMGNIGSLMRFRTGAFYTGAAVCPVIIKYNPYPWDDDFKKMVFKIITQHEITVDVHVNDLIYPPFDDKKIDKVRNYMAQIGNLELSRISNKFIKE